VTVGTHQRDWEELASLDPLWAIRNSPGTRYGNWDVDAFFATGEDDVADAMRQLEELGLPTGTGAALDFGCGVGRASRALASRFGRVTGVDISNTMIELAREHNREIDNVEFVHNTAPDLAVLGDARFDLVYTRSVLQHLPDRESVHGFVREFVRVLAPGGCTAIHIPTHIPRRYRMLLVRRLYVALHALGVPPRVLYERLQLNPVRMLFVEEATMRRWLEEAGARVLAADTRARSFGIRSTTFFATPDGQSAPAS